MSLQHKKVYFVSDAHLGLPDYQKSLEREKKLVRWLDFVKTDAEEIYFLGDIFDFWHEWKRAAPQGFTRFLGRLAEVADSGIPLHFFTGNHDIWIYNYLPREIGMKLYREPVKKEIRGKKFYLAHGDGLGPNDVGYKLLKKIFTNKFLQWCFKRLHPDFSLWLGHRWSLSRRMTERKPWFKGVDNEWLCLHSKEILKKEHFDFFVYGHRHVPINIELAPDIRYINLGDWLISFTYGVFDGENFEVKKFEN
ncbi:MAG: UDP-2,3-diacylglucosamine diphosphatase [Bacteroidales bacterium]